jgi:hypothetical protein
MIWSTINLATSIDLSDPQYSLEAVMSELHPDYTFQENAIRYLKEIKAGGLTLFDIETILICLLIIRFLYYSIRYNPITSIKLCAIGGISCYCWWIVLNDCVKGYYEGMEYQTLLTRMYYEHDSYRDELEENLEEKWQIIKLERLIKGKNPEEIRLRHIVRTVFDWVSENVIFKVLPMIDLEPLTMVTNFIYKIVVEKWDLIYDSVSGFFVSLYPYAIYTFFIRKQKKLMPYHIRWHYTFIILTTPYHNYVPACAARAEVFIAQTLVPRNRLIEAGELEIIIGCVALTHMAFVTTAMLHALFNQYFYIPLFSFTTELHIGKRPKESFYSGGYTAWQDHWNFWDEKSYRSALRLWWGWLGRGVQKEDKEIRKQSKQDRLNFYKESTDVWIIRKLASLIKFIMNIGKKK